MPRHHGLLVSVLPCAPQWKLDLELPTGNYDTCSAMPTESSFPPIVIPNLDLWAFLFERKDKPFPDDKGQTPRPYSA